MPPLPQLAREVAGSFVSGLLDDGNSARRKLHIVGGFAASGLRFAAGMTVGRLGARPARPMRLWDYERCSFSRLVREALSTLDLDAEVRPCPIGGARFRPELDGGRVPRLEDPSTGEMVIGSRVIVEHLYRRYGDGRPPVLLNAPPVRLATGLLSLVLNAQRGAHARPSRAPERPLELWSFEASPYCRMVRQLLCELELPYLLHNVAKDSPRRPDFIALTGKMQVPFLVDPNTSARLFDSLAIERYLEATYALPR